MASFRYQAINEKGTTVTGVIEADSVETAQLSLAMKGYIPSKVRNEKTDSGISLPSWVSALTERVKTQDLIIFTKQFRSMLQAGIPIVRVLNVLEQQTDNKVLKRVITSTAQDIKNGLSLKEALDRHPKVFSPLYRSMVGAGEVSGTMPDVLKRLIYIIEHEAKVKADVRSALQYPAIVLLALGVAFFVLLTFVIPKFVAVFASAHIALPMPTRVALLLHHILIDYRYFMLIGLVAVITGLRLYFKTEEGRFQRDSLILRLPVLGPLFVKAALSRFASIFAILISSGIPVMNVMSLLSGTIGNTAIARSLDRVRDRMGEGKGISDPLRSARYFTPMVVDMIAIGEESGNLEEMLKEITVHYDDEVAYAVKGLSDALGPFLIVGLAVVVGFFALAIFLPMWDLTKMVK